MDVIAGMLMSAADAPAYALDASSFWQELIEAARRLWVTVPIAIGLGLLGAVVLARWRRQQRRGLPALRKLTQGTGLTGTDLRTLDRLAVAAGLPNCGGLLISHGLFRHCLELAGGPDLDGLERRLFGGRDR